MEPHVKSDSLLVVIKLLLSWDIVSHWMLLLHMDDSAEGRLRGRLGWYGLHSFPAATIVAVTTEEEDILPI